MEVRKITIESEGYPENLRSIHKPPRELYVSGKLSLSDRDAVAIVGTRTPTFYGLAQAEKLSYELALCGITIVSGMARGIDSAAHRGALKAGGKTIAIMGSGHNRIYPPENKKLCEEIAEKGAVLSEFSPDEPPLKTNFPRRNRIISGLSKGVVVVEAAKKSGALITADFALDEGRDVFAVPGNVNSGKSAGTNALIKEGAKLVESAADILEELGYKIESEKKEASLPGTGVKNIRVSVTEEEKLIMDIIKHEPMPIDDISNVMNIPVERLAGVLLKLELKKLVKTLPGENFVRI